MTFLSGYSFRFSVYGFETKLSSSSCGIRAFLGDSWRGVAGGVRSIWTFCWLEAWFPLFDWLGVSFVSGSLGPGALLRGMKAALWR